MESIKYLAICQCADGTKAFEEFAVEGEALEYIKNFLALAPERAWGDLRKITTTTTNEVIGSYATTDEF